MRTADPQNIKSDFLAGIQDVEDALDAVTGSTVAVKSRNIIAEYSFLGAAILLEGFISDLFVAYINKDNKRFVNAMTGQMAMTSKDDTASRAISFAHIDIATHLTIEKIRKILDPKGWNVSFIDSVDLKRKGGLWLAPPYRTHFTGLSPSHSALFEATKSVRNFLAHRSKASLDMMQTSLQAPNLPQGFRRGANMVHAVGSFLDSKPPASAHTRIEAYLQEVRAIANQLCP